MPNPYFLGSTPDGALGDSPRYLYLIKRNDDGELFLVRSDQLRDKSSIELNNEGEPVDNFEDFEPGVDYLDGIDEDHELTYENLLWPQYRWDDRSILYYVDDDGHLTQRINQNYIYPTGHSS
jgi:hypothetical protein